MTIFLNLSMWSLESWLQYVLCYVTLTFLFGHYHLISSSLSPHKCLCQMCTSVKVSCVHGKQPGKQDGCCSDGRGIKTAMRQKDTVMCFEFAFLSHGWSHVHHIFLSLCSHNLNHNKHRVSDLRWGIDDVFIIHSHWCRTEAFVSCAMLR